MQGVEPVEQKTRTEFSIKNASVAMTARIVVILSGFLTRVVLTHTLSADYVGINGLLSNILGALTLSEMGVDVALVYSLYVPAANHNIEKQKSLIRLYSRVYPLIAGVVVGIGAAMYPLIRVLMRTRPDVEQFALIYALYVLNTACTYFFAYRSLLFLADQRNYINTRFYSAFLLLQDVFQIILLVFTHNYVLFLLAQIVCNLARNFSSYLYSGRRYPFLSDKHTVPVGTEERQKLLRNSSAMLIHRVGSVIINNTDNLCLTFFSGLRTVGAYANYYLIIGSIRQIADNMVRGIAGSVGNLAADGDRQRVSRVFRLTLFAVNWLYSFCAICLFELLNPFVELAFGREYVFSVPVTAVLCLNFYLNGLRQAVLVFRDSLGLFWYDRYKTVAESLVNLGTSILLALRMGTIGVFIGTTISIVFVSMWVEPLVLYRKYLGQPVREYFILLGRYMTVSTGAFLAVITAVHFTGGGTLLVIFLKRLVCCMLVPEVVYWLFFRKTEVYHQLIRALKGYRKNGAKRNERKV